MIAHRISTLEGWPSFSQIPLRVFRSGWLMLVLVLVLVTGAGVGAGRWLSF